MIGMGIPLHRIPDIRALYQLDPLAASPIDFEKDFQMPPHGVRLLLASCIVKLSHELSL